MSSGNSGKLRRKHRVRFIKFGDKLNLRSIEKWNFIDADAVPRQFVRN